MGARQIKSPGGPRGRPRKGDQAVTSRRRAGSIRPVTGWVDQSLWRALRVHAAANDTTLSDLVSCAIEKYLRPFVEKNAS
jgi:hypothetical protein